MPYEGYQGLRVRVDRGVAWVTLDNPPINLLTARLMHELDRLGQELERDDQVRVVVFESANPEFFLAHFDLHSILRIPTDPQPPPRELNVFHRMVDRFRTMPKATIAKIEGRARGGGSEFALSLDMRFAAIGRAVLSQPEVALGIIPGGTGTQRLARLMGRGRALEAILGGFDFDAELAERYGWVNRALPPEDLGPFVERLAYRIAACSPAAIRAAKAAVDAALPSPIPGMLEEIYQFNEAVRTPEAQRLLRKALELGAQTREAELDLGGTFLDRLLQAD